MRSEIFHVLLPASVCQGGRDSLMMMTLKWGNGIDETDSGKLLRPILDGIQSEIVSFLGEELENHFHTVFPQLRFNAHYLWNGLGHPVLPEEKHG